MKITTKSMKGNKNDNLNPFDDSSDENFLGDLDNETTTSENPEEDQQAFFPESGSEDLFFLPMGNQEPSDQKVRERYWTEETEQAVVDFLFLNEHFFEYRIKEEIDDAKKQKRPVNDEFCKEMIKRMKEVLKIKNREKLREQIFKEKIRVPLNRLIENIMFNFKLFRNGIDVKTLHRDCISFVYTKFTNFNPWQNTKSFSFFGTVAKNYLMGCKKEHDKSMKINLDFEITRNEAEEKEIINPGETDKLQQSLHLFNHVIRNIEEEINKGHWSKNDKNVADSIITIFKNHEILGLYNKNELYQQIKMITGLETKDITYSLHRLRIFYKISKQEFIKKKKEE